MKLFVCPLEALPQTVSGSGARSLVSLSGPGKAIPRPEGLDAFLTLEFNDIPEPRDDLIAPQESDVEAIIEFVKSSPPHAPMIFQCWMGISRSTAALIIAALALRPDIEPQSIARTVRKHAPEATPNPLMVAHADAIMGYNGKLCQAVQEIGRGDDAFIGKPFSIDLETVI